jgi:hypothetical protein
MKKLVFFLPCLASQDEQQSDTCLQLITHHP